MQALLDSFNNTWEVIMSIVKLLTDILSDMLFVVETGLTYISQIPQYFVWIPVETLGIFIACITVLIILRIVGRDG